MQIEFIPERDMNSAFSLPLVFSLLEVHLELFQLELESKNHLGLDSLHVSSCGPLSGNSLISFCFYIDSAQFVKDVRTECVPGEVRM